MSNVLKTKRILVTGALGLVGRAVANRLEADGACVTKVDSITRSGVDVLGIDLVNEPWPKGDWAAIVHSAAMLPTTFDGEEAEAASARNRQLDDLAIEESVKCGAHLVYFSSGSVYGDTIGKIVANTTPSPKTGYASQKLASERQIAARHKSASIFRLVAPYGEQQIRSTVLRRFICLALRNDTLRYYGTGNRTQDFLHVDDVAQAVSLAIAQDACGTWPLASGTAISMKQLAERVVELTASASSIEAAGIDDPEEGRNVQYCIERLRTELGFVPVVTLEDGIARWARTLRQEGNFGDSHL
jgi:UDP-glucose 4-epimerase